MEQIKIGTCIPGKLAEKWLPAMKNYDFECFAVNFHMTYGGIDIRELAPKVQDILAGTGKTVTTLGYYCNALENESQRRDLEYAIDNAHLSARRRFRPLPARSRARTCPPRCRASRWFSPNWRAAPRITA